MTRVLSKLSHNPINALITLITWILLVVIINIISPSLSDVTSNEQEEFLPADVESVKAINLQLDKYPTNSGLSAIVVFHATENFFSIDGNIDIDNINQLKNFVYFFQDNEELKLIDNILSVYDSPEAAASLISPDGSTMTVLINIGGNPADEDFQKTVDVIAEKAEEFGGILKIESGVTGPASIFTDAIRVFQSIDIQVTMVTVLLVLVILFIIYRSPGLALIPLILVGTSLILAQSLAALIADNFDIAVNGQITAIMSVLLFGAGTDYVLFIISRYREELGKNQNRFLAMSETVKKVAPSIIGSASTTIVAMMLLIFALSGSFRTMGPMLALAVGVVLIAGITVIPVTIALMGKWAFWPISIDSNIKRANKKGVWHRIGNFVSLKPKFVFISTTIILGISILPIFSLIPSFNFIDGYPDDAQSKIGYELMKKGFPPGELSPSNIFITSSSENIVERREFVEELAKKIEIMDGVNKVMGSTRPNGFYVDENSPESFAGLRFNSKDGSTTRLDIVFDGDPYSEKSLNQITEIRDISSKHLSDSKVRNIDILVGGQTAVQTDNKNAIDRDMLVLAPIVLLAIFLVLIILQKSIISPVYLMFSIIISYLATYGLSVFIFQNILGHNGVAYQNPVWIFVFLVALGADYNIFVMSRIREEVQKSGYIKGIAEAIGRTGGVVTSAGIILAGTFSVLTTLPLRDVFQLGFAVMLGVLIDTFIVRALLVPSMAAMLGKYNWWPSRKVLDK